MTMTTVYTEWPVDELITGLESVPTVVAGGTSILESDLAAVRAVAEANLVGLGVGKPPFFTNYALPPLDIAEETARAEAAENALAALIDGLSTTVSPAFTGTPTAPTATTGTDTTQLATTAFVQAAIDAAGFAPLASPTFTGSPAAPTPAALDNSTKLATTGYADRAVATALSTAESFTTSAVGTETSRAEGVESVLAPKASPTLTGTPLAPTAATSTNTTQIATTAFVQAALPTALPPNGSAGGDLSGTFPNPGVAKLGGVAAASYALLASPALIGTPTAPTAAASTNTTQIATTAFITNIFTGGDVTLVGGVATLASTPSVKSVIEGVTLDEMTSPAAAVNMNAQRLTNLSTPQADTDAAQALGSQLAITYYLGSSYVKTIGSTTFAAIDTTNLTISFTAISTQVLLEVEGVFGFFGTPAAGNGVGITFFTHSTTTQVAPQTQIYAATAATSNVGTRARAYLLATGLSPGTAYHWDLAWAASANTADIGSSAGTAATYAGGAGPIIIRAFAQ